MNRILDWFRAPSYTVRYYSIGMMSNKYFVGEYTFTASKREIKNHQTIENVGFYKNLDLLRRHFNWEGKGIWIDYTSEIIRA